MEDIRQLAENYMKLCVDKRQLEEKIFDTKMLVVKSLVASGEIDFLDVNWGRLCRIHQVTPLKYRR
jgi:hypothetical protein